MSRIPYPDPATLSPEKQDVLTGREVRVLNVIRMAMHAPDPFWAAQRQLGRASAIHTSISDADREIVVLRVGYMSESAYEVFHHVSLARAAGLSEAAIAALASGDFAALDPHQRVLAQFVTELVRDISPSDATLVAMRAEFADPQVFEVIAILGYYMMVARMLATGGVELDAEAVTGWRR